ncbi:MULTISPECIES: hypothetical protein [Snodgrassella]|uniref:hypothetical protein n=1 Tax=Snodgrassella TaxID=1193515 RepID=UPI0008156B3A|nr:MULTISPECIES: hypothetical protein [Snodgrassella]MCO6517398.1 hypothetical protein [Snodgrassella sp.]SCC08696.1 hypothetical protein GA0061082_10893 [Snodgrassella sp. R-53583]
MSNDKNKMAYDHALKSPAPSSVKGHVSKYPASSSVKGHVSKSPAPVPTGTSQNGGTNKK